MPASEHLAHNGTNAKHILNLFQESAPKLRRKIAKLEAGCNSKSWPVCLEQGKEDNQLMEDDT